jgi:hypothetical protein
MRVIFCFLVTFFGASASAESDIRPEQLAALTTTFHKAVIWRAPKTELFQDFRALAKRSLPLTQGQLTEMAFYAGAKSADYSSADSDQKGLVDLTVNKMQKLLAAGQPVKQARKLIGTFYDALKPEQIRPDMFRRTNLAWTKTLKIGKKTPYRTAYSQYFGEWNFCAPKKMTITKTNNSNGSVASRETLTVKCKMVNKVVQVVMLDSRGQEVESPIFTDSGDGVVFMNDIPLTFELIKGKESFFYQANSNRQTLTVQFSDTSAE